MLDPIRQQHPCMSKPRHITDWMKSGHSGFAGTLARARRLQELEVLVRGVLHPELAGAVRVANLRGATLVLVTPSAAIAARLRLEAPELARTLKQQGAEGIDQVELRVAPLPGGAV